MNLLGTSGGLVGGLYLTPAGFRVGLVGRPDSGLLDTVWTAVMAGCFSVEVAAISLLYVLMAVFVPAIVVMIVFGGKVDMYSEVIVSGASRV